VLKGQNNKRALTSVLVQRSQPWADALFFRQFGQRSLAVV